MANTFISTSIIPVPGASAPVRSDADLSPGGTKRGPGILAQVIAMLSGSNLLVAVVIFEVSL